LVVSVDVVTVVVVVVVVVVVMLWREWLVTGADSRRLLPSSAVA